LDIQNHGENLSDKSNLGFSLRFIRNYRPNMFDSKSKNVLIRVKRWLGNTYGEYFDSNPPKSLEDTKIESSDEEIEII
jgi:hypothetical protein